MFNDTDGTASLSVILMRLVLLQNEGQDHHSLPQGKDGLKLWSSGKRGVGMGLVLDVYLRNASVILLRSDRFDFHDRTVQFVLADRTVEQQSASR